MKIHRIHLSGTTIAFEMTAGFRHPVQSRFGDVWYSTEKGNDIMIRRMQYA